MAKQKEQTKEKRKALKDQIISAVTPILSSSHKDAAERISKKVKKAADEIAKGFFKEIASLEKKKQKAEAKTSKISNTQKASGSDNGKAAAPKKAVAKNLKKQSPEASVKKADSKEKKTVKK